MCTELSVRLFRVGFIFGAQDDTDEDKEAKERQHEEEFENDVRDE